MTYPDQLVMHEPGVANGDCWRACIAGLLGLETHEVPHFMDLHPEPGMEWWRHSVAFVEEYLPGITLAGQFDPRFPFYLDAVSAEAVQPWPVLILVGRSPRDVPHAVLGDPLTGNMVHDPHPSRAGLVAVEGVYALLRKEWLDG